jgi:hypothetical protein
LLLLQVLLVLLLLRTWVEAALAGGWQEGCVAPQHTPGNNSMHHGGRLGLRGAVQYPDADATHERQPTCIKCLEPPLRYRTCR